MGLCPQCGNNNADDAKFCSRCGVGLTEPPPSAPTVSVSDPALAEQEQAWRQFIGPKADHYLQKFTKFTSPSGPKFALTWNWPAFVFELHGALDNATIGKLEPRVNEAMDAGHHLLLFDLLKLTFISSGGLSLFLAAYRRLQGTGSVRFCGLTEDVRRVFSITGLSARLELYDTVEDALVGPGPAS